MRIPLCVAQIALSFARLGAAVKELDPELTALIR